MNAAPVTLPDGTQGYPKTSVVNYGDGLYYAVEDALGNPDQVPEAWALLATRSGGSAVYTDDGIDPSSVMADQHSPYWTLLNARDYLGNNAQIVIDQGGLDINAQNGARNIAYTLGAVSGSIVMWPHQDTHPSGNTAVEWYAADDGLHPTVRLVGISDIDPFHSSVLEAGVDSSGVPYLRLFDQVLHKGWGSGLGGAAGLPNGTTNGQVLTWNGTAWAPANLPADDDSGSGGGAGLPTGATSGQVLTWNGSAWVPQSLPADDDSGSGGGSAFSLTGVYRGDWVPTPAPSAGGDGYAPSYTQDFESGVIPDTLTITGQAYIGDAADWGTGARGTKALILWTQSAHAVSSVEYDVMGGDPNDLAILYWLAYGFSADGRVRITIDDWVATDQVGLNPGSYGQNGAGRFAPGAHHVKIEAIDGGSGNQNILAINQLIFGGTTPTGFSAGVNPGIGSGAGAPPVYTDYAAGELVRYDGDLWLAETDTDNQAAPTDGDAWARLSTHGGGGGTDLPDPGADGNLLTAQSSAWVSAPPAGDDIPDLTLIFENGLV